MAIRQRGKGYQVDFAVKGVRYRTTTTTREAALQWEAETRAAIASGKPVGTGTPQPARSKSVTMGELRDLTIETYWRGTKGEKSALLNSQGVVDYFGADTLPSSIDEVKIHEYTLHLRRDGKAGSTINSKLSALSKMLKLAKKLRLIKERPEIDRVKNAKGRETFVSPEREAALLAQLLFLGAKDIHDLVIFLLDTGARTGEALRLRWENVYADRVVFMDTKNGKNRAVPLTKRAREVLAQKDRSIAGPFTDIKKNGRLRGMWDRAKYQLGLSDDKEFVPHLLRHTFCSRLVQRGVPLVVVKELAGHADISTTMRYSHLSPVNLISAIEALEKGDNVTHLRAV